MPPKTRKYPSRPPSREPAASQAETGHSGREQPPAFCAAGQAQIVSPHFRNDIPRRGGGRPPFLELRSHLVKDTSLRYRGLIGFTPRGISAG
jgi:hypothetical protein